LLWVDCFVKSFRPDFFCSEALYGVFELPLKRNHPKRNGAGVGVGGTDEENLALVFLSTFFIAGFFCCKILLQKKFLTLLLKRTNICHFCCCFRTQETPENARNRGSNRR
jgi:hypothetical protein